jgi:hypothetical protein
VCDRQGSTWTRFTGNTASPGAWGPRLRHALLLAWLVGWVLVFGFLPPHGEASSAPDALEVSGDEITYNGSPVPFLFY